MKTEEKVNNLYVIGLTLVATLGGFLFGFDSGVINGTVKGLESAFNAEDIGSGFNVASMLLGCAVGAFFAGRLADLYGRRSMLIVSSVFFIISAYGSGIAGSSGEFIIYRILGGLAVGAASVMAPAYIAEIAPAKYRGALATIQQVAIIIGLFLSFLSNYQLANISGSAENPLWWDFETWRWMFWMEIIPAAIFFISLLFIPESPRFLVAKQKQTKAEKVLSKLYGTVVGKRKVTEIDASLAKDKHKPKFSDLYDKVKGRVRPIVWIGIGLAVFQQFVGINVVFYYGAVLWQAVGFGESDALLINVVSGALSIGAVAAALVLVDRIGRKPLLVIGSIGMSITLALVVVAFATGSLVADPVTGEETLQLSDAMGMMALIAANAYVVFFNASWGPVMWVMLGEMFPNQIRGLGLAVAGLAQWGANFLVTLTFPILLGSAGLAFAYSLYTIGAVVSIFFVIKYVYETKGKELEEMTA
ncbi:MULTISPECIES: sugar porter family MFS transporter [Roseivirga]|uniref:sugar porter family MFS transporter n=1 Tax=Roseivirga TaxID=290180 RepID=UPI000A6C90F5|nr:MULTISPECIES: sugar porter family MFS transporter [Roseivirga]PWL30280.1 MAG: MFS transporter [Roseivirga sp. XM-24bin3]MBO6497274.1 sugar porter family MFS transporter [Roseivirga sp.]MBO6662636.1 sugar porter family MFS transporter [Roseivirga sp.]MBO6909643.1 sugar porter family MFS transporter [Roseivirga sp.]WPZ10976.1 sugar porter family MFS transporter [Roseivirga spongicola]